jgi:protein phosphatase 1 regulatory subunit 7
LHSRIKSLANLRLPRFAAYLKKLCLRQNLISHLDPDIFHQLTLLEELDLYDNRVKHVQGSFDKLQCLKYVFYRHIDARI